MHASALYRTDSGTVSFGWVSVVPASCGCSRPPASSNELRMFSSIHAHIGARVPLKYAVRNVARRHAGLQRPEPHKRGPTISQSRQVSTHVRLRESADYTCLMYSSAGWAALDHCIAPIVAPSPRTYATSEVAKNGLSNAGGRRPASWCRCCAPFDASGERDLVNQPDFRRTVREGKQGEGSQGTYQSYRRHRPHQSPGTMMSPPPRRANPCEVFKKRDLDFGKRILIGASREVATVNICVHQYSIHTLRRC
jgi:hypothetical protein